jgi:hypothetical protein
MDVLTMILACSLYPDDQLVRVLVDVAGRDNPYFVGDAKRLDTYERASSLEEGLKIIQEIARKGGRPAVGLMGIPISWAGRFGVRDAALFDPCTNIAVGTAMLSQFVQECRLRASRKRRFRSHRSPRPIGDEMLRPCVLQRFGDELGIAGFFQAVMREISERSAPDVLDATGTALRSPVFVDGSDHSQTSTGSWSSARLFLGEEEHVKGEGATLRSSSRPEDADGREAKRSKR